MTDQRESTEWLDKIINAVGEGIIVIQDEDIVLVNTAASEMLEYEKDDLLFRSFEELVETVSRRHDKSMIDALSLGENLSRFHTRLVSKTGDVLHVEVNPTQFSLDGEPAVLAAIKNISREIALESAVTELENRFATLYDMSPIAYFTLNREGVIEQVNQAAEELLGCDAGEILGRPISSFMPEPLEGYNAGADIIREALKGKSVSGIETAMVCPDGRELWVGVSSRALSAGGEKPTEIGFMALDMTWRRGAEQRLKEESERANLYLDIMSSDLNEVYQENIFSVEDLIASLSPPDREREILKSISRNIRRAARMIANMRVLIGIKDAPPDKVKTDLYPHFKKAVREAERDYETKNLVVKSNIEDDEFEVAGHAWIWSIFFNIIHNALRYNPKDKVTLDVKAKLVDDGNAVRVEFRDKGPGIPDDIKKLVFRRSGDAEETYKTKGLGLTVVDRYVQDMGGQIWIEDRVKGDPSKGSKFVVILPIWKEKLVLPNIVFFKSDHCVFCGPMLEMLTSILGELGISKSILEIINIDDPEVGMTEDDLPALPTIRLVDEELTGYVSDDDLRSSVMKMIMAHAG
jgi:PAS domain S-box-containing protein